MPVQTMYIDVDMTLVDDNGDIYTGVIEKLEQWQKKYTMICWSHTGGEYAKRTCIRNGIEKFFKYFLDKPDIIVDDHPAFLLEYPAKIVIDDPEAWDKPDRELFSKSRRGEGNA